MKIMNISKEVEKVVLELDADELVRLCNVLGNVLCAQEKYNDKLHYKLYGDLMIARDLCQYEYIDGYCFEKIAECRSKLNRQ